MKLSWWKALGGFFLAAALSLPAMGANTALPGTLNFIEGQASIESQPLTSKSVGSADLQPGQTLATQNGRAEILLTPGVFLRLDRNSAVKMISPSLTNTQIQLDRGRAEIEVAELHKENNLQVKGDDVTTQLVKKGLYGFSADPDLVQVFKGEAHVLDGENTIKVKGGHELNLANVAQSKPQKFDKDTAENDFYNWSKLRSEYLSESSANAAQIYVGNGWGGPGWYWDPLFSGYTFIPGAGIAYSPFGWGFYSPGVIYSPYIYRARIGVPYAYHGPGQGFHHFHPAAPIPGGVGRFGRAPGVGHVGGFRAGGFHR